MSAVPALASFRRIVVKVGSSLLVDPAKGPKAEWLAALVDDLASLHAKGVELLVVSSGAIALGRTVLGYARGALTLERSQAAAAVGQIALARLWSEALSRHGVTAGQVLITPQDTEERRRYLNARATLDELLARRAVPVINENDTVATVEIRYGDNDRLAARVPPWRARICSSCCPTSTALHRAAAEGPRRDSDPCRARITPRSRRWLAVRPSEFSRGGMTTKVEAAKIAVTGGAAMIIANGKRLNPIRAVAEGANCTWFMTASDPVSARKRWIGGSLAVQGALTVDDGAARALRDGRSLLPAGVRQVEGPSSAATPSSCGGEDGGEIGRGLSGYDAAEARAVMGAKTGDIPAILAMQAARR